MCEKASEGYEYQPDLVELRYIPQIIFAHAYFIFSDWQFVDMHLYFLMQHFGNSLALCFF